MELDRDDENLIRKYLLGELEPNPVESIEERLLRDDTLIALVLLVEDELIEDYARGALSSSEQERFKSHFLSTRKRQQKLVMVQEIRRHASAVAAAPVSAPKSKSWRLWFLFPRWKLAALTVLLIALGIGVWRIFIYRSAIDRGLIALNQAYSKQRPLESRITGFAYAPFSETRGTGQPQVDYRARDLSAVLLLEAVSDKPSGPALHALGRFYLTQQEFDKAISQFEEALKSSPNNANLQGDLGAALLEQARVLSSRNESAKGFENLAASLEHLERALKLNPDLQEALFNKALCLQSMTLTNQAREAWTQYLQHDPSSPWAEEAKRKLQLLTESKKPTSSSEVLTDYLDAFSRSDHERAWRIISQTREMITGRMVTFQLARNFLSADATGRTEEAAQLLQALKYIGSLELERSGDPFVAELADYYARIRHTDHAVLAQAQAEITAGYEQCLTSNYDSAISHFTKAQLLFTTASDIWEAKLTEYWIGYCQSQAEELRESNIILGSLADYCKDHNYKWLLSLAIGWTANNYGLLNEHSKAVRHDRQALELAEAISDSYHIQRLNTHLGLQYSYVGRYDRALDHYYRSLTLAAITASAPRQTWRNFAFTSETLYAIKDYAAAASFEKEALELAVSELKDPTLIHRSYIHLAAIYSDQQQYDEAVGYAESSMRVAQSIQDDSAARLIANSHRQLAYISRRSGNCEQALLHYNQAIELSAGKDNVLRSYETHKGLLLCYITVNDTQAVRRELSLVMQLFEGNRASIQEEQNRNTFFDNEQSVYDLAIDYEFKQADYKQAFAYSEESRARSLLDALHGGAAISEAGGEPDVLFSSVSHPLSLMEIKKRIPARVQVIQYSVLKDRLLIWLLSKTQFEVIEVKIPREQIEASVHDYVQLVSENNESQQAAVKREAAALYGQLISPVVARLNKNDVVCVVTDKALFHLPFASLISPTGEYFITDFSLLVAPSLSALVLCSEAAQARSQSKDESLLSVGNPTFDRHLYPDLPDLPHATKEAREVTDFYPRATMYIGPAALKESIEREMANVDVMHFACHYLVDETSPMNSKLLLATNPRNRNSNGDGAIAAYEILKHKLWRPRLVVLSACQTNIERYYGGEGMIGLSRTFVSAGAPVVVASQWLVDSDATAELMIKFHDYRKRRGLPTVEALRRAQIDLLSDPDERYQQPFYWAAFVVMGGYAEF